MADQFFPQNEQEKSFFELCKAHDLTFEYSDDFTTWQKGRDQLQRIKQDAAALPEDRAKAIWNAVVDLKIGNPVRAQEWKWR